MHHPPSLSSLSTLPCTHLLSSSNSCPLVFYCYYTCIRRYINILKYDLLSLYKVLLCVFSGLTIWHWVTNWYALPWVSPFLLLSAFLSCLHLFVGLSLCGCFMFALACLLLLSCSAHVEAVMLVRCYGCSFWPS